MFTPRIEILPPPQRALWGELGPTPKAFVLYGGTALALRLGHRRSEDFDFFSSATFSPDTLLRELSYLQDAKVVQRAENTLTCIVERQGCIQLPFFGGLELWRVREPDAAPENGIGVASLVDLAGCKVAVVQQRAETKDYLGLAAILESGLSLTTALAAAKTIYGRQFNPEISLRALTSFNEGDLGQLDPSVKQKLLAAVSVVRLQEIPVLDGIPGIRTQGENA